MRLFGKPLRKKSRRAFPRSTVLIFGFERLSQNSTIGRHPFKVDKEIITEIGSSGGQGGLGLGTRASKIIRFRSVLRFVNPLFLANTIRYSPQCRPRSLSARSKRLLKAIAVYPSSHLGSEGSLLRRVEGVGTRLLAFCLWGIDKETRFWSIVRRAKCSIF